MTTQTIYLDFAATCPVHPEVREVIAEGLACWANPSSVHAPGRAARAALERARSDVADALGWRHEVIFTGGATEALAIAWQQSRGAGKWASAVEHTAVLRHAATRVIAVDGNGLIAPAHLPKVDLIAVQHVNNETGVIQPLAEIAARVHAAGGLLLADCAQSAAKLDLPDADLITIAGHKIGAPPGIGALLVADAGMLAATGGQERGYRPGTENLPYILGLAAALKLDRGWLAEATALRGWWDEQWRALGGEVIGAGAPRLPTVGAYRLPGINASVLLIRADAKGIAISAGSACSSGSIKPSHVMTAMGLDDAATREVFRVSIGRTTTRADLEALLAVVRAMISARIAA
ncbi:MAG: aminotransferase class V-fold PLP-dependent enzyme [Pseudomonadota bacterium]|nr:aminotransferase class V-fold PLP-dependent enzyme [Pseudomonadota bacterium]